MDDARSGQGAHRAHSDSAHSDNSAHSESAHGDNSAHSDGAHGDNSVHSDGAHLADSAGARLTELEIKASFTEDLLDTLNHIVARQQQQIDRLMREIAELRQQQPEPAAPPFRSLRDELPPHY